MLAGETDDVARFMDVIPGVLYLLFTSMKKSNSFVSRLASEG
jgi:hypothetical protein